MILIDEPVKPRLRAFFWCLAFAVGALHVWAHRNDLNPDSVSYIEMAEGAVRSGWHALANGYWSPLYPAFLSVGFRILHPSMYWEFTVVHLVNFAVYLADLFCFEFFIKELLAARRTEAASKDNLKPVPQKIFWIWGYLLFIWSNQYWLRPEQVNPDIIVAGLVYVATALLLRIYRGRGDWLAFTGLGAVLGVAYLAKAAMFPLSFLFFACAFLLFGMTRGSYSRALTKFALALAIFAMIASPLIVALSREKHRVTFGDSGKINYAMHVDGAPFMTHWQGEPPGTGVPAHPTRKVSANPPIYEFAQPIAGSYPPWYDPSYWYEGIITHFSLRGQLWVLFKSSNIYFKLFSRSGALYVVFLALILIVRKTGKWEWGGRRIWLVWLPSLGTLVMFALVVAKQRYVSAFSLMLVFGILSSARISFAREEVLRKRVILATILAPALAIMSSSVVNLRDILRNRPYEEQVMAEGLRDMGIPPGTQIASIGSGLEAYWAHLAEVRIIAEIPEKGMSFLAVDPPKRREVLNKFLELGAKVVVTKNAAVADSTEGMAASEEYRILCLAATSEHSMNRNCDTNLVRCPWAQKEINIPYHDEEWGVPVHDENKWFEFLILEGAQAGLSWDTILRKRARYREVLDGFDPSKVAQYDKKKVRELLKDEGIIRNKLKIAATIANAQAFLKIRDEFGSSDGYIWRFVEGRPRQNGWKTHKQVPAKTPQSDALSKDLQKRGFRFVGSTICYALMQATGMVNDHLVSCFRYAEISR